MSQHAHAVADLEEWAAETGLRLPYDPDAIVIGETEGVAFNLVTGRADAIADDHAQVLDTRTWLADLERACCGRVVIQWAIRPEVYFAQQEAQ